MQPFGGTVEIAGFGKHNELLQLAQVHSDMQWISLPKNLILDARSALHYAVSSPESLKQ
jgi:hypothetical protein